MYTFLLKWMSRKYANIFMLLWYLFLLLLVFHFLQLQSGRFKYLGF